MAICVGLLLIDPNSVKNPECELNPSCAWKFGCDLLSHSEVIVVTNKWIMKVSKAIYSLKWSFWGWQKQFYQFYENPKEVLFISLLAKDFVLLSIAECIQRGLDV